MGFKKGQITMFMIIGIVIFIVLAFLLFISNSIKADKVKKNVEVIGTMFEKQGRYHGYVVSCMEQAMKKGLFLVGMQGGPIYDYQAMGGKHYLGPSNGYPYGKYVLPYAYDGIIYNMSYGIVSPQLGSLYHPDIPYYPYGLTKLVSNPKIISPFYVNLFGNFPSNPLTPLCDYHGNNRKNISDTVACETYDSRNQHDDNSIQEYLERYIENYTMQCIKLEGLPELSSYNVRKGNITARVTFGEQHVFADIVMPIYIELGKVKSVIQLKDFHVPLDIRLKKIHELVSHLTESEVNNIFFNVVRDASTINNCKDITSGNAVCLKQGMEIIKKSNVCLGSGLCTEGNYDDVLIIRDRESLLDGRPYVFQMAVENRLPALDLIREEIGTGSYNYDYVAFVGDEIRIEPVGIDPDEDQHNAQGFMDYIYHYYGWKEDYDEYYDPHCGPLHDPDCQLNIPVARHNWTRSIDYNNTMRIASYKTDENDLGVHTVKVEVCDEGNLCDYQAIIIFVSNGSFVGGNNGYNDIPEGYASLEDFYLLTSPMTAAYTWVSPFISWHKWNISYESTGVSTLLAETEEANLSLPSVLYTILSIKGIVTSSFFPSAQNYTTMVDIYSKNTGDGSLELKRPGGDDKNTVQVMECLPHRHASPPYPYNTTSDPFQANHSCCLGDPLYPDQPNWGTYAGTGHVCYSEISYGCRDDSNYKDFTDFTGPPVLAYDDKGHSSPDRDNDMYERVFRRYCEAGRGNICLGAMTDTRTHIEECTECQKCVFSSSTAPGCEDIGFGETICNSAYACTHGYAQPYSGTPGPFSCQASCSFGACNASINCGCNKTDCGAICDSPDNYNWSSSMCSYNCNDYLHEHSTGGINVCEFLSSEATVCSSPDPADPSCFTVDVSGTIYNVCPSDPSYTIDIDSQAPMPVTYCLDSNQCYYGVACTGEGTYYTVGDFCPAAGTPADQAGTSDDLCYYNPTGAVSCSFEGNCSYFMVWGMDCAAGDPVVDGFCDLLPAGQCHYNIVCDSTAGWQQDQDACLCHDNGTSCFYGAACTAAGCDYQEDANSVCSGTLTCTDSGWHCV